MRRAVIGALLLLVVTSGLSACSKSNHDRKLVLDALRRTQQLSGRFSYDDKVTGTDTTVRGIVADDFRYKAELAVNGLPEVDEVVDDDALADLFLQPAAVPLLARRSPAGALLAPPQDAAQVGSSGISVVDALTTRRWVVDATGAPNVLTAAGSHPVGQDPFFDARDVFAYATTAVGQAANIVRYDPESISPTYKTADDPFPKPAHGARLARYDLAAVAIPRRNSTSNGTNQAVPGVPNLRRMAIYIQGGLVVRIMEDIDADWKLSDLKRNYSLTLSGPIPQQAAAALVAINAVRTGQGNEPIRARTMDFQYVDPGRSYDVPLPTVAVYGPLDVLVNRGPATTSSAGTSAAPTTAAPTAS